MTNSILYSCHNAVATITLNRPTVLNAIDLAMCEQLHTQLIVAGRDPQVRAVLITGNGRAFCAGGDLRFALEVNPDSPGASFLALTNILHTCIAQMRNMAKPVIAAINGPAAGAGFFLALACDLRIMADIAYLKQANTSHGLSVPAGGTFTLPRLVGLGRALEMVILDEPIAASRALELGLVSRVVSAATLLSEATQLAAQAARMPIHTLGRVKCLLNTTYDTTLEEQLQRERLEVAASANDPEGREGVLAFLEKRQPAYAALG